MTNCVPPLYKKEEAVCTPPPQNNEFKMITNYIVLAHVSFNATVRLKTKWSAVLSLSTVK